MTAPPVVLLVPHDGDLHGLLTEGLCEAKPPTVGLRVQHHSRGQDSTLCRVCYHEWPCDQRGVEDRRWVVGHTGGTQALALAWNNKRVPEGMDRAHRCHDKTWVEPGCEEGAASGDQPLELAERCVAAGIATLILPNADGREGPC